MEHKNLMEFPGNTRSQKLLGRLHAALWDRETVTATFASIKDAGGKWVRIPVILVTDREGQEHLIDWHQEWTIEAGEGKNPAV